MTFLAKDVMSRASLILQDNGAVRWTAMELHLYLCDGLRELVSIKPNANSKTTSLPLAQGTLQTLPDTYTMLSRVIRNLSTGHPNPVGTSAIRMLRDRTMLDAQIPNWQSADGMPFSKEVVHAIQDVSDLRRFYVVPGNDGTGIIEVVVGVVPLPVAKPATPALALIIDNYTAPVDIPDIYQNCLIDYCLYRAFSKDAGIPGAAERAAGHYSMFKTAIGAQHSGEMAMSLASQNTAAASG